MEQILPTTPSRNQPLQHQDLGLLASRNVRDDFYCLSHSLGGTLLGQPWETVPHLPWACAGTVPFSRGLLQVQPITSPESCSTELATSVQVKSDRLLRLDPTSPLYGWKIENQRMEASPVIFPPQVPDMLDLSPTVPKYP